MISTQKKNKNKKHFQDLPPTPRQNQLIKSKFSQYKLNLTSITPSSIDLTT